MAELTNKRPKIERLSPAAAIAGGDVCIDGENFTHRNHARPRVCFGETEAPVTVAADDFLVATVPAGAAGHFCTGTV